jgi:hypothetical protein
MGEAMSRVMSKVVGAYSHCWGDGMAYLRLDKLPCEVCDEPPGCGSSSAAWMKACAISLRC